VRFTRDFQQRAAPQPAPPFPEPVSIGKLGAPGVARIPPPLKWNGSFHGATIALSAEIFLKNLLAACKCFLIFV
jgi:hypothetical protein